MRRVLLSALLMAFVAIQSVEGFSQSTGVFGTYVGLMKHSKVSKDQFAKLDFVYSRETSNSMQLVAVLSVYFGDFGSKEYVSYHFDDVKYNLITGDLVFDQADHDITMVTTSFSGGFLEAEVRSSVAGNVGTIVLRKDGSGVPSRQHILSVTGKYEGSCDGVDTVLQLNTYKTSSDTFRLGNPFGSYEINGQVGDQETFSCPNARRKPCTVDLINEGTYDYFSGELTLFGKRTSYECSVDGGSLDCGGCSFTKVFGDSDSGTVRKPLTSVNRLSSVIVDDNSALSSSIGSIAGEYKGYLHHERLDQYQGGSVNIVTYQDPSGGTQGFKMSATANLYFGDFSSRERIPYKFHERTYSLLSPVFVFERTEEDVDAILQVTDLGQGVVRGVWYSLLFGRVGTFEFTKGSLPTLPGDAKVFNRVAGEYESPTFLLRVSTRLDTSPINSENPFFPQVFSGRFWYKSGIAPRINVTGGSYDFYTGKFALDAKNGERIAVGENDSNESTLKLMWPPKIITPILPEFNEETFTK